MKDKICEPRCVKINASGLDLESERRLNKRERENGKLNRTDRIYSFIIGTGIKKEREREKKAVRDDAVCDVMSPAAGNSRGSHGRAGRFGPLKSI